MRCGSCAMVLSLRWGMLLVAMFALVMTGYMARFYVTFVGIPDIPQGPLTDLDWATYLLECGVRSSLGNPLQASAAFDRDFKGKTVQWRGTMLQVSESMFSRHFIYFRMTPPQYFNGMPDLGLTFDRILTAKVADISVLDEVTFEASLLSLAKRGQAHFGILWDIVAVTKYDASKQEAQKHFSFFFSPLQQIPLLAQRLHQMKQNNSATLTELSDTETDSFGESTVASGSRIKVINVLKNTSRDNDTQVIGESQHSEDNVDDIDDSHFHRKKRHVEPRKIEEYSSDSAHLEPYEYPPTFENMPKQRNNLTPNDNVPEQQPETGQHDTVEEPQAPAVPQETADTKVSEMLPEKTDAPHMSQVSQQDTGNEKDETAGKT